MAKNRGSDVLVAKLLQEANHLIEVLPGISRIPKELDVKYITQAHDGLETTAAGLKRANDARSQAVAQKVERVRALIKHVYPTGTLLMLRARNAEGQCIATGLYAALNRTAVATPLSCPANGPVVSLKTRRRPACENYPCGRCR